MQLPGIVQFRKCTLSDKELADAVAPNLCKMYNEPYRVPSRSIPARPNEDFDLIVGELVVRFIEKSGKLDDLFVLLDKGEALDEFFFSLKEWSCPQTIEDYEANSVRGVEAYTEQEDELRQLRNYEAETAAAINEAGGCSTCGDISGFNCICEDDMWFEEDDFEPCDLCERQDCSNNGCFLRKYVLID